jgi:transposase
MSVKDRAPEQIEVTREEIAHLLERARPALDPDDFAILEKIVHSFVYVSGLLEERGTTIRKLKSLFAGFQTEKLEKIFPEIAEAKAAEGGDNAPGTPGAVAPEAGSDGESVAPPKEKPKGHGRNGAEAYTGAEHVHIPHPTLKPGDPCPEPGCNGKVYEFEPLVGVRVVGQAPLGAKVRTAAQVRCNLCLTIFCACSPEDLDFEKYDESAASMIAVLTYGSGMPFYRLQGLQESLGIPVPDATQWDVVHRAAKLVAPAFEELIRQAAQGDVLHNDDTPMKILEYMKKKEKKEKEDGG